MGQEQLLPEMATPPGPFRPLYKGYGNGGILLPLTGTVFIVWYLRALGAKIGKNCGIYVGGKAGLMTEPDLVEVRDSPLMEFLY